jgi:hypothetical protein
VDKYLVIIGSDLFEVKADDSQGARYKAAVEFKTKYHLDNPLGPVVYHSRARMVTKPPEQFETTEDVLEDLKLEEDSTK